MRENWYRCHSLDSNFGNKLGRERRSRLQLSKRIWISTRTAGRPRRMRHLWGRLSSERQKILTKWRKRDVIRVRVRPKKPSNTPRRKRSNAQICQTCLWIGQKTPSNELLRKRLTLDHRPCLSENSFSGLRVIWTRNGWSRAWGLPSSKDRDWTKSGTRWSKTEKSEFHWEAQKQRRLERWRDRRWRDDIETDGDTDRRGWQTDKRDLKRRKID